MTNWAGWIAIVTLAASGCGIDRSVAELPGVADSTAGASDTGGSSDGSSSDAGDQGDARPSPDVVIDATTTADGGPDAASDSGPRLDVGSDADPGADAGATVDSGPNVVDAAPANDAVPGPDASLVDAAPVPDGEAAPDAAQPDAAQPDAAPPSDLDEDGFTEDNGDCDDDDRDRFPGAPELCDGVDNDCDDVIDQFVISCYAGDPATLGVGPCRPGLRACRDGVFEPCRGQVLPGDAETCGNGVDDNCNGVADDGCDEDGDQFTVAQGDCNDAVFEINPGAAEVCDGVDNNCDGAIDGMSRACYDGPAQTANTGICADGTSLCTEGLFGPCEGQVIPQAGEACGNFADDNCDGVVDEGCEVDPCIDVDLDSAVTVTSACITAGTGARGIVRVQLRDLAGEALPNRDVEITPVPALPMIGEATEEIDGAYFRVFAAPAVPGEVRFAVTVGCGDQRQALTAAPRVTVTSGIAVGDAVGTGGCSPIDGNVSALVVDADTGAPIEGAWMMAGIAAVNVLQTDATSAVAGMGGEAANSTRTDADGRAYLVDFGAVLRGPQSVTLGADGYENVTLAGIDASAMTVPLRPAFPPAPARGAVGGSLGELDDLRPDDQTDVGLVLGTFDLPFLSTFALSRLLSRYECWDPVTRAPFGGLVAPALIPGNLFIPDQTELLFGFGVRIDPHPFDVNPSRIGRDDYVALAGKVPTDDVVTTLSGGGGLNALLELMTLEEIGVTRDLDVDGVVEGITVPMTESLAANASCRVSNTPASADVFCVAAGDWSGENGTGRLFPMGFRTIPAEALVGAPADAPLTTVADAGIFTGIGYLAATVALFLDRDTAPAGLANAASAVLDRATLSRDGGIVVADSFFDTTSISRIGQTVAWDAVATDTSPPVDVCRVEFVRRIGESYQPGDCGSARTESREVPVWTLYTQGDPASATFPLLPGGWPRAQVGGIVDTDETPESDTIRTRVTCMGLGLAPEWTFDDGDFGDLVDGLTHLSVNEVFF